MLILTNRWRQPLRQNFRPRDRIEAGANFEFCNDFGKPPDKFVVDLGVHKDPIGVRHVVDPSATGYAKNMAHANRFQ